MWCWPWDLKRKVLFLFLAEPEITPGQCFVLCDLGSMIQWYFLLWCLWYAWLPFKYFACWYGCLKCFGISLVKPLNNNLLKFKYVEPCLIFVCFVPCPCSAIIYSDAFPLYPVKGVSPPVLWDRTLNLSTTNSHRVRCVPRSLRSISGSLLNIILAYRYSVNLVNQFNKTHTYKSYETDTQGFIFLTAEYCL